MEKSVSWTVERQNVANLYAIRAEVEKKFRAQEKKVDKAKAKHAALLKEWQHLSAVITLMHTYLPGVDNMDESTTIADI